MSRRPISGEFPEMKRNCLVRWPTIYQGVLFVVGGRPRPADSNPRRGGLGRPPRTELRGGCLTYRVWAWLFVATASSRGDVRNRIQDVNPKTGHKARLARGGIDLRITYPWYVAHSSLWVPNVQSVSFTIPPHHSSKTFMLMSGGQLSLPCLNRHSLSQLQ